MARKLAVKYALRQLVVQSATAVAVQIIVPPVLSRAGLNEDEVRAGLAILQATQTLAAIKSTEFGSWSSRRRSGVTSRKNTSPPPSAPKFPTPSPPQFWVKSILFNGIKVFQRDDLIDPLRMDKYGYTSLQRMRAGEPPIGPDGKAIVLHHMLQSESHSLAEVTQTFHEVNSRVIHINPSTIRSGINRATFQVFRKEYWRNRALDFERTQI